MHYLRSWFLLILVAAVLTLAGCGSSSSGGGTPSDPMAATAGGSGGTPIFGNIDPGTGTTGITLTTDRTTVDVNNGQVLVTAKLVNNGVAVGGVPVTFSIVAPTNGPATIDSGLTTVTTDSNGEARTLITTGSTLSTTNVIVSASAKIGTQVALANTTFQIVRGTGVITIGAIPVKSTNVDSSMVSTQVFQQQIPIKLTDANGNVRVGAPVTLSVYTKSGTSSITFTQPTISTDANGVAIFDAIVSMTAPAAGTTSVESVIYKATTADTNPIVAYAAGYYSVTSTATVASSSEPNIILTTDSTSYDVNDGSVLATAKIVRSGVPLSGVQVTFNVVAPVNGPATVESGLGTVTTDSNGIAVTRITTGDVSAITNVIIKATATIGTQTPTATATFQLVPNLATQPTITLTTDKAVYDASNGTVTATARINKYGAAVSGVTVSYSVLSGPVSVTYATPVTDKNGTSIATLTVGSAKAASNAIIQATATIENKQYIAYAQFQVNGYDPTALPVPTLNMILTSDITQVDVNNGTVMLNANLLYGSDYLINRVDGTQAFITAGSHVSDQPVTFNVIAGPATIAGSTPLTDKNGNAKAILTTGNTLITTNVIVEVSTLFDGKTYRAYTTIQIVRGSGVIKFITLKQPTDPDGTLVTLPYTVSFDSPATTVTFPQLIPFKVTDSNGNPRVGVPVTLDVYSQSGVSGIVINYLKNGVVEPSANTVTTDSAGTGIFNITVTAPVPVTPGFSYSEGVVYKAVTNDAIPITAYGGYLVTVTREKAP